MRPIGILYEHPEWFAPLFAELERRRLPFTRIPAHDFAFDPDEVIAPYSLVVNRVSPSSYLRGHTSAIFQTRDYLAHLERLGVPVVNGSRAYANELSKARQLGLLASLGLPHPRSRVVNSLAAIPAAAASLTYPIMIKPNIGGSGALMQRFDTPADLDRSLANGDLDGVLGLDFTAIVQEFHPPRGGSVVRVEALDGKFLYAIRIENDPNAGYNLCPADICQTDDAPVPADASCPVEISAKQQRRIENYQPPARVIDAVLRIFATAGIDVGGVEYLESERDDDIVFYDINSLSNFVTDAPRLVGFDPFARFVDYLEQRAGSLQPV